LQVTKVFKFNGILRNKETEESGHAKRRRSTLHRQPSNEILDYIPELEYDDPRIQLATSEGEMDNYEVTETISDRNLHLKV
jgi:hypothetical protein